MPDIITALAQKMLQSQHDVQEMALEASLQGGEHGASTIYHGLQCTSRVDPAVPYGNHFTFPSPEAYERWIQNGAPTE